MSDQEPAMSPISKVVVAAEIDGHVFFLDLDQEKLKFLFSVSCRLTADHQVPVLEAPRWFDIDRPIDWIAKVKREKDGQPHS